MRVAALRIGGEPGHWRELGFELAADGIVMLSNARLEIDPRRERGTIESWSLEGMDPPQSVDGLVTEAGVRGGPVHRHPNGAVTVDHVVVLTPSLERTTRAFAELGIPRRRVRDAGEGVRQGFFLVDDLLVEVVEEIVRANDEAARFWGLTIAVTDIDRSARLLGDRLGKVKDAVQPGRRIATVRSEASGGLPLALITQRERRAG